MQKNLFADQSDDVTQDDVFDADVAHNDEGVGTMPLAALLRPESLDDFVGQEHLLGEGKILRKIIAKDHLRSLVFYGPPGTGKTSLAFIISKVTKSHFEKINAVLANVSDIKKILEKARQFKRIDPSKKFILFVDEIHRFNKAQQDVLMPSVESGLLVLIGATTHNPFFSINGPLLSRAMILELKPLEAAHICVILSRAVHFYEQNIASHAVIMNDDVVPSIARCVGGDARHALNVLETVLWLAADDTDTEMTITSAHVEEAMQKKIVDYDKNGDQHYDTISAFIKSVRGSDPDAAVYWLAKMIYAGEDIRFIMRRMLILASEDIGNADPQALTLAASCLQAVEFVGLPEARIILSQCATYLATAPKSNAAYQAINTALADVENGNIQVVPTHLKGTGYAGAAQLGHGAGYKYPHNYDGHYIPQAYTGESKKYYMPTDNGYERTIKDYLRSLNAADTV